MPLHSKIFTKCRTQRARSGHVAACTRAHWSLAAVRLPAVREAQRKGATGLGSTSKARGSRRTRPRQEGLTQAACRRGGGGGRRAVVDVDSVLGVELHERKHKASETLVGIK